jgi:AcrR family transcriptional regulator
LWRNVTVLNEEERERVHEVARTIFLEKPLEEVTLKDIADESKINLKTISKEYETPQHILREIILQGVDVTTNMFKRMVDARGKSNIKLLRLVRELLKLYETHAPLFRLVSINFVTLEQIDLGIKKVLTDKELDRYRQNTAILGRIIAQGQSEGLFIKDIDPLEGAYILRGMVNAAIQFWQLLRKDEPLHKHADTVTRIFLKGLYK